MNLNDFAKQLTAKNRFIKASFGGFAGSGKTRTATEFIIGAYKALNYTKPILFIDNEKGSRFLIPMFEKAGIKTLVKDTINLTDVLEAFKYLQNGDIDLLFIDSLTKIWYKYINDYKVKNRKVFMTLQDWGKILPAWQETFADAFVNLEGSCVFTGRAGYTYDMEENPETHKKEFVKSGFKMKMAGETPYEPDLNIWMELNQDIEDGKAIVSRQALVLKDRSGIIDGKTFNNPKYSDFKPVVDYLIQMPEGEIIGSTNNENIAPHEDYDTRREKREIELEKIKGLFDKYAFGTSKEDKQLKALIADKIFKTTSWTELEKMKFDLLEKYRIELTAFFEFWGDADDKIEYINNYISSDEF